MDINKNNIEGISFILLYIKLNFYSSLNGISVLLFQPQSLGTMMEEGMGRL